MSDPRLDILNRYAEKAGELLPDAARELHDALSTHLEPDWEHSASMPSPGEVMHPDYGDEPHHTLLLAWLFDPQRSGPIAKVLWSEWLDWLSHRIETPERREAIQAAQQALISSDSMGFRTLNVSPRQLKRETDNHDVLAYTRSGDVGMVIEAKINAPEQPRQLARHVESVQKRREKPERTVFVFLAKPNAPEPNTWGRWRDHWHVVTWLEFADVLSDRVATNGTLSPAAQVMVHQCARIFRRTGGQPHEADGRDKQRLRLAEIKADSTETPGFPWQRHGELVQLALEARLRMAKSEIPALGRLYLEHLDAIEAGLRVLQQAGSAVIRETFARIQSADVEINVSDTPRIKQRWALPDGKEFVLRMRWAAALPTLEFTLEGTKGKRAEPLATRVAPDALLRDAVAECERAWLAAAVEIASEFDKRWRTATVEIDARGQSSAQVALWTKLVALVRSNAVPAGCLLNVERGSNDNWTGYLDWFTTAMPQTHWFLGIPREGKGDEIVLATSLQAGPELARTDEPTHEWLDCGDLYIRRWSQAENPETIVAEALAAFERAWPQLTPRA